MSSHLVVASILLGISALLNLYLWNANGELREMAGLACQYQIADFGLCSRYQLD
jgi:hypothetical protein